MTFEAALTDLNALVAELEDGNLGLDASVERFRKATELAEYCKRLIADARLRVTELQSDESGSQFSNGVGDDVPF
jgi:exodeoxyribonuclease VII small subunit